MTARICDKCLERKPIYPAYFVVSKDVRLTGDYCRDCLEGIEETLKVFFMIPVKTFSPEVMTDQ